MLLIDWPGLQLGRQVVQYRTGSDDRAVHAAIVGKTGVVPTVLFPLPMFLQSRPRRNHPRQI
jgi:hypothetical protein